MTLPNSYSNLKNKLFNFWKSSDNNRIKIDVHINDQDLIVTELGRSTSKNRLITRFVDFDLDWVDFDIHNFSEFEQETKEIFKSWEINVVGLLFEQIPALRHNFLIRFGGGEPLLSFEIQDDTIVQSVNYVLVNDLENTNNNDLTFYYGLYLADNHGLEEVDENGIQVKLDLTLLNPNLYI